jgi:hypothetical protein
LPQHAVEHIVGATLRVCRTQRVVAARQKIELEIWDALAMALPVLDTAPAWSRSSSLAA